MINLARLRFYFLHNFPLTFSFENKKHSEGPLNNKMKLVICGMFIGIFVLGDLLNTVSSSPDGNGLPIGKHTSITGQGGDGKDFIVKLLSHLRKMT